LVGLWVLVQTLAFACGCDVSGPSGMFGTPKILLAFDGLGLVLVGIGRWDFHPLGEILFLPFAFLGSLLAFAFLFALFWFLCLLP